MSLKDNWNKTPEIPHKTAINIAFAAWAFVVLSLFVIGVDALVAFFVPAGIMLAGYLFARLSP